MDQQLNTAGLPAARPPTSPFLADGDIATVRDELRGDKLATRIARVVTWRTAGSVQNLRVEVRRDGVFLDGECDTFYSKQLAQQAAMDLTDETPLTNRILVR